MSVPDGLVYTVVGLVITHCAALGAYLFKKVLDLERLSQKVLDLEAKLERLKKK